MSFPKTLQNYLDLITSEHAQQPNFVATLTAVLNPLIQIQNVFTSMITLFDLDLTPVGNQLDIIGQWVGAPRNINSPFADVFFTWDDVQADGWDFGVWQQAGSPDAVVSLPDDIYLIFINAKIAINQWNGTTDGIYNLWATVLPQYNMLIIDFQNMHFDVAIQGTVPDSLTKALLVGGFLVPRPEGVEIDNYILPVDTNPLFAWDIENASMGGWDQASWGDYVTPT